MRHRKTMSLKECSLKKPPRLTTNFPYKQIPLIRKSSASKGGGN